MGRDVYIGPYAYIGDGAIIEDEVQIYPHVYVGDMTRIKSQTILYAGVKIYAKCEVGERCIVHAGAVIGSDGFGFAQDSDGRFIKIPQIGNVIVGNDCEIGANTTIDRAASGATRIHDNVKLDNLVQIAQVGLVGHIEIADGVQIGAQSGISNSVRSAKDPLMGTPAMPVHEFYKSSVLFRRFPEFSDELTRLRSELDRLRADFESTKQANGADSKNEN